MTLSPSIHSPNPCVNTWYVNNWAAHGHAGLLLVRLAQLHGAVQVQVVGLGHEAEHVEAEAEGGALAVAARAPLGRVQEGERQVAGTPGERAEGVRRESSTGEEQMEMRSCRHPLRSREWEESSVELGWGSWVAQQSLTRSRKESAGSVTDTSTHTWACWLTGGQGYHHSELIQV